MTFEKTHLKELFQESQKPLFILNLEKIYPQGFLKYFLSPDELNSKKFFYSFGEILQLKKAITCSYDNSQRIHLKSEQQSINDNLDIKDDSNWNKALVWIDFYCGRSNSLPSNFFETSPFFFPLGQSYVFLALKNKDHPLLKNRLNLSIDWFNSHLSFFHSSELKFLIETFPEINITPELKWLSQQNLETLNSLSAGEDSLQSSENFLLKQVSQAPIQRTILEKTYDLTSTYLIYSKESWVKFLNSHNLKLIPIHETTFCETLFGNNCLVEENTNLSDQIKKPTILLFGLSLLLSFLTLIWSLQRFKSQKQDEEQQRFILQILTHELRTPLTSMSFTSELILSEFDIIPEKISDWILRLSNDIEKLKRLNNRSRLYLFKLKIAGQTQIEGWFFLNTQIGSENPLIQSPIANSSNKNKDLVLSWQEILSRSYSPAEQRKRTFLLGRCLGWEILQLGTSI